MSRLLCGEFYLEVKMATMLRFLSGCHVRPDPLVNISFPKISMKAAWNGV